MKRAFLLLALMLGLTAVLAAQQTSIQSPNGGESWKKGEFHQIKFACGLNSGAASLILVRVTSSTPTAPLSRTGYQEVGLIGTVWLAPNTPAYSFNWEVGRLPSGTAPAAAGYKVLVRIATPSTIISDLSDAPFAIGSAPTIDIFAINDGLAVTEQRQASLNYRFSGYPVPNKYRLHYSQNTGTMETVSPWMPLPTGSWPVYELPDKPGDYIIGLVLANGFGESPVKVDTIRYAPAVPLKDFAINAATLVCGGFPDMNPAWYSCRCTSFTLAAPSPADCFCTSTGSVIVKTEGAVLGNKLEYEFFGGRLLNPGWSFVSLSYSDANCSPALTGGGSAVLAMPQPGSRDIRFKVRIWTSGTLRITRCEFRINSLVIRGPADQPVSEAFK
jgi:hypothetical protein